MALEEIIDVLAFGVTAPRVSSCLGLYLSPETVYISETHIEKGKAVVDHLVRIPVPAPEGVKAPGGPTTATLNTDFLMDNAKLSALIRQSMSQVRWNSKDVMVTLSHHLGLLRYFAMPAVERRFWKSAVPLEAKKYIPIPFEVLSHDYQVVPLGPDANNKPRQGALVAVTQRKNLANITALLESLGLNLIGMEVAPCSVLRLWETLEKSSAGKTHCQVHFDGGNIRILLADKGLPVFFRELFLGADAAMTDFRKVDLGGCVAFAQKQLGVGNLGQLRVSGAASALSSWAEAFTQEVGAKAVVQDTAALLGIKGGDWGGYASIGASIKNLAPSPMNLDLGKVGKVTDDERRTARDILGLTGGVALILALFGVFNTLLYEYKARELKAYKREPEIEGIFAGKKDTDIQDMLRLMQTQMDMSKSLDPDSGLKVTSVLKDVTESLPDKVWLTNFSLRNGLINATGALDLNLSGHAVAATLQQEQDLCFAYRDRLQKSPIVGKYFKDIQVYVNGKPMDISQAGAEGLDQGALTRRLEARTDFRIVARAKK
ncbi:MAG: pilus assembly protein PilM [Elusimicrobia bacterium]|nr:pilus assembly protein PilM [Elusimicrobiota bacterium]